MISPETWLNSLSTHRLRCPNQASISSGSCPGAEFSQRKQNFENQSECSLLVCRSRFRLCSEACSLRANAERPDTDLLLDFLDLRSQPMGFVHSPSNIQYSFTIPVYRVKPKWFFGFSCTLDITIWMVPRHERTVINCGARVHWDMQILYLLKSWVLCQEVELW